MLLAFQGVFPRLHPTVFLARTAVVAGDVEIGEESSVWFGVVLRGDVMPIRIGRRTSVQDLTVVHVTAGAHGTTIGDEVTIGHRVVLHGCEIRSRCLVGMGAIVLDGAVVGEDSIVAAGSLVPGGMVVPPRTLVMGTPARVRKDLAETDLDEILRSADAYVGLAGTYREENE